MRRAVYTPVKFSNKKHFDADFNVNMVYIGGEYALHTLYVTRYKSMDSITGLVIIRVIGNTILKYFNKAFVEC